MSLPNKRKRQPYNDYVSNCRRKNIYWEISFDDFNELTSKNCVYCDRPPHRVRNGWFYNGIDRLDNNKGYTIKNSVPCCHPCNRVKSDLLSFEEMREVGKILKKIWESALLKRKATSP